MPDDHGPSITIGTVDSQEHRAAREVLGKSTPEALALADALRAREADLGQWLQDPANRKRLAANPTAALAEFVPPEVMKAAGVGGRIPPELVKRLSGLQVKPVTQPQSTPAMDLFLKVWTFVTASQANLQAFQADVRGTVRNVDTAAPQPVVDAVVAAYDQAMGIFSIALVDPSYFTGQVISGLAVHGSAELP